MSRFVIFGFRVLRLGVSGSRFGVSLSGFGVLRFGVWGSMLGVRGSGFSRFGVFGYGDSWFGVSWFEVSGQGFRFRVGFQVRDFMVPGFGVGV